MASEAAKLGEKSLRCDTVVEGKHNCNEEESAKKIIESFTSEEIVLNTSAKKQHYGKSIQSSDMHVGFSTTLRHEGLAVTNSVILKEDEFSKDQSSLALIGI